MTTTYTEDATMSEKARIVKGVCTTGTEAASQLGAATKGLLLTGLAHWEVRVETTGAAFSAGTIDAYLQNPVTGKWARRRDMDQAVAGGADEAFGDFEIHGAKEGSRLAFLPNGLGQANEIYIVGAYREGGR